MLQFRSILNVYNVRQFCIIMCRLDNMQKWVQHQQQLSSPSAAGLHGHGHGQLHVGVGVTVPPNFGSPSVAASAASAAGGVGAAAAAALSLSNNECPASATVSALSGNSAVLNSSSLNSVLGIDTNAAVSPHSHLTPVSFHMVSCFHRPIIPTTRFNTVHTI